MGRKESLPRFWFTSAFAAADDSRLPLETDPHPLILLPLSAGLISSSGSYLMRTNHVSNWSMGWETWWSGVGARWNISVGPLKNPSVCFLCQLQIFTCDQCLGLCIEDLKKNPKPLYGCLFIMMIFYFLRHIILSVENVCSSRIKSESVFRPSQYIYPQGKIWIINYCK